MAGTQRLLAIAMSFFLTSVPGAGKPAALGVIVEADRANLDSQGVANGTTIYDGDRLTTGDGGSLRIAAGESMLYLAAQSGVIVREGTDGATKRLEAELLLGTIEFSTTAGSTAEIVVNAASIRPMAAARGVVQVRRVGPREIVVYARQGPAQISYQGETATIAAGKSYRVLLNPADDGTAGGGGAGDDQTKKTVQPPEKKFVMVVVVAAAILTIPLVKRALESPDKP